MSLLRNKHVLTAALVAPLLALMSYYAIDFFVGETPQPAEQGQSYQLVEKPNCRWASGACGLKNADFELNLAPEWTSEGRLLLMLNSQFPLEGVVAALATGGTTNPLPMDLQPASGDGLSWSLELDAPDPAQDRLRLVASANGSLWYGDAALKFVLPATDR